MKTKSGNLIEQYGERYSTATIYLLFTIASVLVAVILFGLLHSTGVMQLVFPGTIDKANFGGAFAGFLATLILLIKSYNKISKNKVFSITGNVFFADGKPAEGAVVFVLGVDRRKETDSTGWFRIEVNEQNNWVIKAMYENGVAELMVERQKLLEPVCLTLPQSGPTVPLTMRSYKDYKHLEITVWSEVDTDVFLDGEYLMKVDHSSGFDYAVARINTHPSSEITFKSPSFEITKRVTQVADLQKGKCEIRIGTQRMSDIAITEKQKKEAMGREADIPIIIEHLLKEVSSSARYTAARKLGYIGEKSAIPALIEALKSDPDPYVKACIAEALGRIGDVSVIPILEEEFEKYDRKPSYGYIFEAALRDLNFIKLRQ